MQNSQSKYKFKQINLANWNYYYWNPNSWRKLKIGIFVMIIKCFKVYFMLFKSAGKAHSRKWNEHKTWNSVTTYILSPTLVMLTTTILYHVYTVLKKHREDPKTSLRMSKSQQTLIHLLVFEACYQEGVI